MANNSHLKDLATSLGEDQSGPLALLGDILDGVEDGVGIATHGGAQLTFNAAAKRILSLTDASTSVDALPQSVELYHLHDFSPLAQEELPIVQALHGIVTKDTQLFVRHLRGGDGAVIRLSAQPLRGSDGKIVGAIAIFRDVGESRRAEEELRAANTKLAGWVAELERRARVSLLMNDMADLLQSCRTLKEFFEIVSLFAGRIFEREPGAVYLVNSSRSALETVVEWGDFGQRDKFHAPDACWALRRGRVHRTGGDSLGPACDHSVLGQGRSSTCVPMLGQGEALGVLHVTESPFDASPGSDLGAVMAESRLRTTIAVAEHIALALANLRLRETLRTQAIRDPLTGLFNRRHMEVSLERELARATRAGGTVAAVMIDIDHFKRFNDTFGHAAADVTLRETSAVIRSLLRSDDIACRYGGEELVVILPDADTKTAERIAESMRLAIAAQQVRHQGTSLGTITASFGVAVFPTNAGSAEGLLKAADESLYEAKRRGRDRVVVREIATVTERLSIAAPHGAVSPARNGVA